MPTVTRDAADQVLSRRTLLAARALIRVIGAWPDTVDVEFSATDQDPRVIFVTAARRRYGVGVRVAFGYEQLVRDIGGEPSSVDHVIERAIYQWNTLGCQHEYTDNEYTDSDTCVVCGRRRGPLDEH